ncbi:VOC family protein [Salinivibrio costicola]|uniref:VOC family protein n=1 Tax=Salinivibrio costicola TaxID=51367 RepID=A0ABX6K3V4_SALCS|nr:VOC family protein [Salinivibrio costicola]QIR04906.1 VOC family protein [Salinivibrio costicola]
MIDHLSTYATNFSVTKEFYRSVFEPLGYAVQMEFVAEWNTDFPTQRMCAFGPSDRPIFWVIETQTPYTPRHIAFSAPTRATVEAFYDAGMEAGGMDNGKPGLRPMYHNHYFGAFLIDPDGKNIEAVCHHPES